MGTYSKAQNQCRRLPREIASLERRGMEEEAKRTREHLKRAQEQLAKRSGR